MAPSYQPDWQVWILDARIYSTPAAEVQDVTKLSSQLNSGNNMSCHSCGIDCMTDTLRRTFVSLGNNIRMIFAEEA
jgi:hypothetical protein